jgi:RHS repeat-associated protein
VDRRPGVLLTGGIRPESEPIRQTDLVLDESFRDQLPSDVDPQRDKDAFTADPRVNPPKVVVFTPSPADGRWQSGETSWLAKDSAASSRLGGQSINLPTAADLSGITAVPRISRSEQISLTGGVSGGIGTIGGSVATGDSTGELDYLDLNGDQFPDVAGAGGIQYSDPTGTLGGTKGTMPDGSVRRSGNESGNASAGSPARTISTGRGQAAPPGNGTANTAQSGNDMPPLGVGGSLGTSSSDGEFDLLDINGDSLPDRVYENGNVALNLGYKFAQTPEPWPGGALNDGEGSNAGVNIGFNTDFYGFAGGTSFGQGDTGTSATLQDMNGDGLTDRVFAGSPIRVALNTGNGFAPAQPFFGSLSGINNDVNAKLGAGAYFTFSFCLLLVTGCIIVNPGADTYTGANRTGQTLRDIDGDGYADHLASDTDSELTVAQNRTGRTNLLKSVTRPLGSRIDLNYARDGNTYDQPQSRWVLTEVSINDGHPGDGPDVQRSTFTYSGGTWDLGSTGFVTDDQGQLYEHLNYFPTGETWVEEKEDPGQPVPHQYTGKEFDPETGYYYYGARYYDPRTSLWQSPDTELDGYLDGLPNDGVYTSSNLSLYSYAANNPIKLTDPDGRWVGARCRRRRHRRPGGRGHRGLPAVPVRGVQRPASGRRRGRWSRRRRPGRRDLRRLGPRYRRRGPGHRVRRPRGGRQRGGRRHRSGRQR